MPNRPIQIVSGRHPFQLAVLGALVGVGIGLMIGGVPPESVTKTMPPVLLLAWEWGLVVSGCVGLAGVAMPDYPRTTRSLSIELSGVTFLATILSMYAIALFTYAGLRATVPGGITAGLAGAAIHRSVQIFRDRRLLHSALNEGNTVAVCVLAEPTEEGG